MQSVFPPAEQFVEQALTEVDMGDSCTAGLCSAIFWGYRGKDSYFQLFARNVLDNRCLGLSSLQFAGLEPCSFSVSPDSHWERCSFISSYPRFALVNCEDAKKERRERAAHMLAISSVSFTIYVEEESEGKASGWAWGSRFYPIWVHNLGSKVDWLMLLPLR